MAVQQAGGPEALPTFTLQVSFDTSARRGKMPPPESKQSLSAWGPSALPRLSSGGSAGRCGAMGKGPTRVQCVCFHSTALLSVPVLTAGKTLAKRLLKPNYSKVRHVVFLLS